MTHKLLVVPRLHHRALRHHNDDVGLGQPLVGARCYDAGLERYGMGTYLEKKNINTIVFFYSYYTERVFFPLVEEIKIKTVSNFLLFMSNLKKKSFFMYTKSSNIGVQWRDAVRMRQVRCNT